MAGSAHDSRICWARRPSACPSIRPRRNWPRGRAPSRSSAGARCRRWPGRVLAEAALDRGDDVAGYAYARVGYHRGLDMLRRNGWKGAGPVPWNARAEPGIPPGAVRARPGGRAVRGERRGGQGAGVPDRRRPADPGRAAALTSVATRLVAGVSASRGPDAAVRCACRTSSGPSGAGSRCRHSRRSSRSCRSAPHGPGWSWAGDRWPANRRWVTVTARPFSRSGSTRSRSAGPAQHPVLVDVDGAVDRTQVPDARPARRRRRHAPAAPGRPRRRRPGRPPRLRAADPTDRSPASGAGEA